MQASPLAAFQQAFCNHLRAEGRSTPPPGTAPRGMKAYRELLHNNIESFLLACFPVSRQCLGARPWKKLVRTFFARHAASSPYFRDIPAEFLAWLPRSPVATPEWLPHLAHWEWLELDIALQPDTPWPDGPLSLNPSARLATYPCPVHLLAPRRKKPQKTVWLMAYRDNSPDGNSPVRFIELTAGSYALLSLLQDGTPLNTALTQLAQAWGQSAGSLGAYAEGLLGQLATEGVVHLETTDSA